MRSRVQTCFLFVFLLSVLAGCNGKGSFEQASIDKESWRQQPQKMTNSIGMQLAQIPPGEFLMGSPESDMANLDSGPQHLVRITRPFYLGVYEVTQVEYEEVMGVRPSHFYSSGIGSEEVKGLNTDSFPVDQVTWGQASEFCRRLSELPEEVAAGRTYRLPTEAEWEYACRAGTITSYSFGNAINLTQANISASGAGKDSQPIKRTEEVGSYPPNSFGLYDMHGNVWEWCSDGKREYTRSSQTDPNGGHAMHYVIRGGGWDFPAQFCRSDYRKEALAGYVYFGFRVVCEVDETADHTP